MRHVTARFPQVGTDISNVATTTDRRIGIPIEIPSQNAKNPERMAQIGCVVCMLQRMLSTMIVQVKRYSMEANCRRRWTHSCAQTFTYFHEVLALACAPMLTCAHTHVEVDDRSRLRCNNSLNCIWNCWTQLRRGIHVHEFHARAMPYTNIASDVDVRTHTNGLVPHTSIHEVSCSQKVVRMYRRSSPEIQHTYIHLCIPI